MGSFNERLWSAGVGVINVRGREGKRERERVPQKDPHLQTGYWHVN